MAERRPVYASMLREWARGDIRAKKTTDSGTREKRRDESGNRARTREKTRLDRGERGTMCPQCDKYDFWD